MSVKRFGYGFEIDGNTGPFVKYEDCAALEARCAALAAENAGLKAAADFATASDMWEELGGNVMRYQYQEWYADRLKSAMKTTTTDAFLAEVRAQGVEAFASVLEARGKHHEYVEIANAYAAQLRKGVQS
ncbi:hypothetical protein A0R60_0244 [Enterobacter asburiae]|nr:hypothetical protein A0R60_0244 [Enterobacter asburiae]